MECFSLALSRRGLLLFALCRTASFLLRMERFPSLQRIHIKTDRQMRAESGRSLRPLDDLIAAEHLFIHRLTAGRHRCVVWRDLLMQLLGVDLDARLSLLMRLFLTFCQCVHIILNSPVPFIHKHLPFMLTL